MELYETMSPNTEPGSHIRYSFPDAGYPDDQANAKRHLKVNRIYTVDYVTEGGWSSYVYLIEVPSVPFDITLFENV